MFLRAALGLCVVLATWFASGRPLVAQIPVLGGMLDPAIDEPGKPFSYFWHPTDVIGTLYAPVATEVTPEGYLYTGFGELMFFMGIPPDPVHVRIKTLRDGYLPIVEYDFCRQGIRYRFTAFAADLGGAMARLPVNFVEVRIENEAAEPRAALFSSAFRFSAPVNHLRGSPAAYRFDQRFNLLPKKLTEGQTKFNANWRYTFGDDAVLRDGRLVYTFSRQPEPDQLTLSLADKGYSLYRYFTGDIEGSREPRHSGQYDTPMGVVTYRVPLAPGAHCKLVFKMPLAPLPADSPEARQVLAADCHDQLRKTESFWRDLVGRRPPLVFPEAKVQEFLLANTVFDLLAIDHVGENYITNVNKFQYHSFCGGSDVSHMRVGFAYMGLTDIARKTVLYSVAYQFPDGSFDQGRAGPGTSPYYEFFGWNLWCIGRHYQLTRDATFLAEVYPSIVKAMEWEMRTTAADALGLFPPYHGIRDDAALNDVRQTGPNIWALHGMLHAIALAEAAGRPSDVKRFRMEYDRFRAALEKQLAQQVARSGGWIPPAIEKTLLGNHWDNMMLLYPEPLFDPRVTATIARSRQCYREGVLGYVLPLAIGRKGDEFVFNTQPGLHYWHTPDNAQNALVRGGDEDQRLAVKDLYALLLHTTSTHSPQEFSTVPWSTRDYYPADILPDGAASGKIIELLRNMLVREYRDELHLFSSLSPAWLRPGRVIEVRREPTTFGPVSARCEAGAGGLRIELSAAFRQAPAAIVIRLPWFYEAQAVEADGHPVSPAGNQLRLAPTTRLVTIKGRQKSATPEMSFDQAVRDYKQEYARRYAEFLRTGQICP